MAIFNPDVPENKFTAPFNLSKPVGSIAQPESDKSYQYLFTGLGDFFSGAVKASDMVVKDYLSSEIHAKVDKERQGLTDALEKTYGVLKESGASFGTSSDSSEGGGGPNDQKGSGDPLDLNKSPSGLPKELQGLPKTLQVFSGARDNGKISALDYQGRLAKYAKELRERFPGHRDYIDSEISKASGMDPANAYYQSLISQINSAVGNSNKEGEKELAKVRQHVGDDPMVPVIYEKLKNKEIDGTQAMKLLNPIILRKTSIEQKLLELREKSAKRDDFRADAGDLLNDMITNKAATFFNTTTGLTGLTGAKEGKTMTDVAKTVEGLMAGTIEATPETIRPLAGLVQANKLAAQREIMAQARKEGFTHALGEGEVEKRVKEGLSIYDDISNAITNEKWGPANGYLNAVKDLTEGDKYQLLSKSTLKDHFRMMNILEKLGGPEAIKDFFKAILTNPDIPKDFKTYTQQFGAKMIIPNAMLTAEERKSGPPDTPAAALKQLKDAGIKDPKLNEAIVNFAPNVITNPAMPDNLKVETIKKAFGQGNKDLLKNVEPGHWVDNGNRRVWVRGQEHAYQKYTSKQVTAEVKRLSANDPDLWKTYANWAGESFIHNAYARGLADLKSIAAQPWMKLSWKNDQLQLERVARPDVFMQPDVDVHFQKANEAIFRLNMGIDGLKNVATEEGEDVGKLLKSILEQTGSLGEVTPGSMAEELLNTMSGKESNKKVRTQSIKPPTPTGTLRLPKKDESRVEPQNLPGTTPVPLLDPAAGIVMP